MTADQWAQIDKLFEAALSLDPEHRAALLAQCADAELRVELETMIRAYENLGSFLEKPPRFVSAETKTLSLEMLAPGKILRGRYRVVRLVGKGGMGEVYEASDLELDGCRIALKTLRAGVPTAGRSLERFKREIVLGRTVTHPNVCRIFDIDRAESDAGDLIFLTMEYLDGETLYQRLKRSGPLDSATAASIAKEMIAGLTACHRHGIIHRDFKSSNVMLVRKGRWESHAVITDFGLAYTYAENGEEAPLTQAGMILGTPEYMAPEQKEGKPATAASDIYALGIVLCEMLTGERPVGSPSPAISDATWESVILRCIQGDPAARFGSVEEVAAALDEASPAKTRGEPRRWKWLRTAAAAGLIVALLLGWWGYREAHALPELKHVAVLPFRNLGHSANDQVFCEGLAETLTSRLSQLERYQKSFWVVPASETQQIVDAHDAYRKVDATLVVSGSLERLPGKTVLVVNLIDARTRRQLASQDISGTAGELSGLEDDAWQRVADMLDLQLRPEQIRALEASRARVPAAYVAYAEGLGYARRAGIDNIDSSIRQFADAVRLDPSYALARSALGSAYARKYEVTSDPQWLDQARANAQQAVALAPDMAQVHLALGQIDYSVGKDQEAEHELSRALDLDPDVIEAHFYLGRLHQRQGKLADAEHDFRSAVARRPEYWRSHNELATFYYKQGRFADAEHEFLEALRVAPDQPGALGHLGAIYTATGRLEDAVRTFQNELRVGPDADAFANLGTTLMFLGRYAEAVPPMEQAVRLKPSSIDCWRNLGDAYAATGERNKAMEAYRRALELGRRQLNLDPKDGETMASVALFEAHLSRRQEALHLAKQACDIQPSNNEVFFTSALVYEILGNRPAALQALRAAHDKGYSMTDMEREPVLTDLRKSSEYRVWMGQIGVTSAPGRK
jgi:serine/threonine protein kinase/tetratricopeptide (TPR) repeat protein